MVFWIFFKPKFLRWTVEARLKPANRLAEPLFEGGCRIIRKDTTDIHSKMYAFKGD